MTLARVFDNTHIDQKFSLHMSNFGHNFLHEADPALVHDEPLSYPEITKNAYVFAAGFVHYWSEVFLLPVPAWVHREKYKNDAPYFSQPFMHNEIKKLTPIQFAQRNYFIPSMEVVYV
ncbi:MAG: hypothetical protein FWC16_09050 [Defluviitaleaceae bacterium]|nr:hypothetical protein [Defluviitaleaceae bacterium]MCL2275057.1 hypothetical protein [Defluviitaleaceae bacterium]